MATCRIYLFTYKRNNLLPRAVKSLLCQTFTDWVCEVHNDCPGDDFPGAYIASLSDNRFIMYNHKANLGGVKSFNLAFANINEPYASILEDDNWWEPAFLEEIIGLLNSKPRASIAWSNMNLWQEKPGGEWEDLKKTVWPSNNQITAFEWPDPDQAMAAVHSTGALLYRGKDAGKYLIPESTLLNAVELIRERTFEHPVYLINKPLANFAITLSTNRTNDAYTWIASQLMMLASFISTAPDEAGAFKRSLIHHRTKEPTPVANFFLVNLLILKNNRYYCFFTLKDWLAIAKWLLKNGHQLSYIKRYLAAQADVLHFLQAKTMMRYQEQKEDNPH